MDKRTLYVDMDGTLVDFQSGIDRLTPELRAQYEGNEDDCPGIFALMDPKPGAIEGFCRLAEVYDAYILSTAPWKNPSAWSDKLQWVHRHFGEAKGTPAYKRLILSHHKNLNRGHVLIDDRPQHRGVELFEGTVIPFGSVAYPDWPTVVAHLLRDGVS